MDYISIYRQRLAQNGASNEVLDFFNAKNRDKKTFSQGRHSIFKSIGYENGLRTSKEKDDVRQIQIQTLESMLKDQTLTGKEAKDTQSYVRNLKKQLSSPYDLSKPKDISSELSNEAPTPNLALVPYEPKLEEKISSYHEPVVEDTLNLPEVIYLPDTKTKAAKKPINTQSIPNPKRVKKSSYLKVASVASMLLLAGCTYLSNARNANTMTVQQANELHAKRVAEEKAKSDAKKNALRPKRFREEKWKLDELISNYQYNDAARYVESLGWSHETRPTYVNRDEAWKAEMKMDEILLKNQWHATEESFQEQNKELSTILHGLAQYYAQIGMDESKEALVVSKKETPKQSVSESFDLPTINPPTVIAELPIAQEYDLSNILMEEPETPILDLNTTPSLSEYLSLFTKLSKPEPKVIPEKIEVKKPTKLEQEVKQTLEDAEKFQHQTGSKMTRFPPFATIAQAQNIIQQSDMQEKQRFVQTSPFALANDDFAMYVARRPGKDELLKKRIELVYHDGGIEDVISDLSGITQVLKHESASNSLAVANRMIDARRMISNDESFSAYHLFKQTKEDEFGMHGKFKDLLSQRGVFREVEASYMDQAATSFLWADWKNCIKNSGLAQQVRSSVNSEIERISDLAQTMLSIEQSKSNEDYLSAMHQYDQAIDLMKDHPWNQSNRFSNLRDIFQKNASTDLKKKARNSKGQERAHWLSQWRAINPKAEKSLSFKWLARNVKPLMQEESFAKN